MIIQKKKKYCKKKIRKRKKLELENFKKNQKDTQVQINLFKINNKIQKKNLIELNNQLFYNTLKNNGFNIDII